MYPSRSAVMSPVAAHASTKDVPDLVPCEDGESVLVRRGVPKRLISAERDGYSRPDQAKRSSGLKLQRYQETDNFRSDKARMHD